MIIHKHVLNHDRHTVLQLPIGSRCVHVAQELESVCVWILRPITAPLAPTPFTCISTGQDIPDDAGTYIGTAHLHGGRTVVHVFQGEPL